MDKQSRIIAKVIGIEGGYVNDASDSGGKTRWGITRNVAIDFGFKGDMRELPKDTAISIYKRGYWDKVNGDSLLKHKEELAHEMFEQSVNMGVSKAVKNLQTVLNALNRIEKDYDDVTVDGVMGGNTIKSVRLLHLKRGTRGLIVLVSYLNALQGAFYIELSQRREKDERFVFGWGSERLSNHGVKV